MRSPPAIARLERAGIAGRWRVRVMRRNLKEALLPEELAAFLVVKERDRAKLAVISRGNMDLVVSHSVDSLGEQGWSVPLKGIQGCLSDDLEFRAEPFKKCPIDAGHLLALWSYLKNLR